MTLNKNKMPTGGSAGSAQAVIGRIAGLQPHNQRMIALAEQVLATIQQLDGDGSWRNMSETRLIEAVTAALRQRQVTLTGLKEIVEPMITAGRARLLEVLQPSVARPA